MTTHKEPTVVNLSKNKGHKHQTTKILAIWDNYFCNWRIWI